MWYIIMIHYGYKLAKQQSYFGIKKYSAYLEYVLL